VHGERAFNAYAETDFADRERLLQARSLAANNDALEDLHTFTGTFNDSDVHLQGVTGAKRWNVVAKRVAVDEVSRIHESGPFRITKALEV
jgi:hypothetical protein